MALQKVKLGGVEVSRLAIGGNCFSGFSHQGDQRDRAMRGYYTTARIKEALHKAEAAGINTFFGRTDNHVIRMLEEYWREGGKIQWFAQTASEHKDPLANIGQAAACGAKGVYVHGGEVDYWWFNNQKDMIGKCLEKMRAAKLAAAGFAAHRCEAHEFIRDTLQPDFQCCCYYDPSVRSNSPDHVVSEHEKFDPAHRDQMAKVIGSLKTPAVHYKVLAAGRTPVEEAFGYAARVMRPRDVMMVGFYLGDDPDLIGKTARLFEQIVQK